jgi:outer membrane protein assembly factor BamB
LISNNGANEIERLTPDGAVKTLIPDVPSPGGQRIQDGFLYFNTGDSAQAGILQTTDGTIQRYDLETGERITWSSGLAMPNGLIFLPSGDAAVGRDSPGWGITRIPFGDPSHPQRNWVETNDSNGMAVDPTGTWLYFDETFQPGGLVMRARLSDPSDAREVASLGQGLVLDDLTIDREGLLYIAANRPAPLGELIRLDPPTGEQCVIATGLGDPSAVKFSCGPGWPGDHLFVVGFQGSVYDVSAPNGTPQPRGTCDAAS